MEVLLASILPGLFWLWYFRRFDLKDREPAARLVQCLFFGALAIFPALVWEAPFRDQLQASNSLWVQLALSFAVVGFGEELFKLLAVMLAVFRAPEFDEPLDGIIYAIAGGIGFAVAENVLYISAFGLAAAPLRGTAAVLAHISFSGLAGFFLGRARFEEAFFGTILKGIGVSAFAHGLYDFLLMSQLVPPWWVIVLVAALQFCLFAAISRATRTPPQR